MKTSLLHHKVLVVITYLFFATVAVAEGSKELMDDINSRAALSTNDGVFASFNSSDADKVNRRLFIHIANPAGEIVYLGFSRGYGSGTGELGNVGGSTDVHYFRIKDPNGNIVFGPQAINASNAIPAGETGYNQIKAGPSTIAGSAGYTPFVFTLPADAVAGDYYIEFNKNSSTVMSSSQCSFDFWDITVADNSGASPTAINGRLWGYRLGFYSKDVSGEYSGTFKGRLYSYTPEGFVQKIDFSNSDFKGGAILVGINSPGPGNTGNIITDRQSVYLKRLVSPGFKLFLNNPDQSIYSSPTNLSASLTANDPIVYNSNSTVSFNYELSMAGQVQILLDFNKNDIYDVGSKDVVLVQNGNVGSNSILWNKKDGLGDTVMPQAMQEIAVKVKYQVGVHHMALPDIEYMSNGFTVENIRPLPAGGYTTKFYWDDRNIFDFSDNKVPYATGPQPNVVELDGANVRRWDNYTSNSTTGFGNSNTINTWWDVYSQTKSVSFQFNNQQILPVNFVSFTVAGNDKTAQLTWVTTAQKNVTNYLVERSTDGKNFSTIGAIQSNETAALQQKYTYVDIDLPATVNSYYYRIRSVDLDGTSLFSEIKSFRAHRYNQNNWSVYPNPILSIGKVELPTDWLNKRIHFTITTISGVNVLQLEKASGAAVEYIDLSSLAKGMYILTVRQGSNVQQQKIIKQ